MPSRACPSRVERRNAARHGRRVGLREDDDDPRADGPAAADGVRLGSRPPRRRRRARARRGDGRAAPLEGHRDGLPGRDECVRPGAGASATRSSSRWSSTGTRADARQPAASASCSRPVGIPPERAQKLPARALGRDAPASRDRDGARVLAARPARRRADDGARRDGAGAGPRAPHLPLERARARARLRDARPADRRADLHPRRGHVRGPDRRAAGRPRRSTTRPGTRTRGCCGPPRRISTRTRRSSRSPACRRGSTRSCTDARSRHAAISRRRAARPSGRSCARSATAT